MQVCTGTQRLKKKFQKGICSFIVINTYHTVGGGGGGDPDMI